MVKKDFNRQIYYQTNGSALIRLAKTGKTAAAFLAVCQKINHQSYEYSH